MANIEYIRDAHYSTGHMDVWFENEEILAEFRRQNIKPFGIPPARIVNPASKFYGRKIYLIEEPGTQIFKLGPLDNQWLETVPTHIAATGDTDNLAHPDLVRLLVQTEGKMPTHNPIVSSEYYGYPIISKQLGGCHVYAFGVERDLNWTAQQEQAQ